MEEKIKTIGVLSANHFSAQLDRVRLRTGRLTERIRIEHPEAAAMIPFLDERHIVMVRQWRYAIGEETVEIPAGKADHGEEIVSCAQRELEEETGYAADRFLPVSAYCPAIGYSNEVIHIFAAGGLKKSSRQLDVDEISKIEILHIDRVFDMILKGEIRDGKTIIGISLFLARQKRGEIPADFFK